MKLHIKEKQDYSKVKNSIKIKHIRADGGIDDQVLTNAITLYYPIYLGGVGSGTVGTSGLSSGRLELYMTDSTVQTTKMLYNYSDYNVTKGIHASGTTLSQSVVEIEGVSYLEIHKQYEYYNTIIESGSFTVNSAQVYYYVTSRYHCVCGTVLDAPIEVNPGDTLIVDYIFRVPYPQTESETIDVPVSSQNVTITNVDIDGNESPGNTLTVSVTRCVSGVGDFPSIPFMPMDAARFGRAFFYEGSSNYTGSQVSGSKSDLVDLTTDVPSYTTRYNQSATLTRSGSSGSRFIDKFRPSIISATSSNRRLDINFDPPIEVPYTHTLTVDVVYDIEFSVD